MKPFRKLRIELRSARRIPPSVLRLKEFSYLAWFVERSFFWFQFLSPAIFFIPTRNLIHIDLHDIDREDEKESFMIERMRHRAQHVDTYILACILFQIILGTLLFRASMTALRPVIQVYACLRILDIAQANINLNVFDRLRYGESSHVTVSMTRNLILSAITYGELMMTFGLLYATMPWNLIGISAPHDCFYFSMVTQLTIGYGDIKPLGVARYLASLQGLVGLFFSLLIMGRFVSFIPAMRTVFGDEGQRERSEERPHQKRRGNKGRGRDRNTERQ
jgi:hypothetical protein